MAINNLEFGAQVSDWVKQTEARLLAVRNQAADEVADRMRAYTPVDLGFLAGTIQGSLNAPTPINPRLTNEANAHIPADASAGQVSLVIANARFEDVIYVCFVMAYAGYVEYGTSRMAPRAMVRRAAAEWPAIVARVSVEAQARASGRAGR